MCTGQAFSLVLYLPGVYYLLYTQNALNKMFILRYTFNKLPLVWFITQRLLFPVTLQFSAQMYCHAYFMSISRAIAHHKIHRHMYRHNCKGQSSGLPS